MAQTYLLTVQNSEFTYTTVQKLQNSQWVEIKDGTYIADGDTLKITYGVSQNAASWRKIETATVNGIAFTSGGQITVKSNITVFVSSDAAKYTEVRGLLPAKAVIGNEVSLDIFESNTKLYCSVQIKAGNMVKYIAPPFLKSDGDRYQTSNVLNLFKLGYGSHQLKFILPEEIYNSMPIDRIGRIEVTCISYDNTCQYVVGSPHVAYYYVYADPDVCKPKIAASVKDINNTTKALTNDDTVLVRGVSQAKCEMTVTAQPLNTTHIAEATVNNRIIYQEWDYSESLPQVSGNLTFTGSLLTSNEFSFHAISARAGIEGATEKITTGWVKYIEPSLNTVEVARGNTGDDDTVYVNFGGYFYNGQFGPNGVTNRIKVRYRYREDGSNTWSNWSDPIADDPADTNYIRLSGLNEYGVFRSGTSSAAGAIPISGTFNHTKSYTFQFEAYDGNGSTGTSAIVLSRSKLVIANCPPSIPVFDWGKSDFNFNVPVKINNVDIFSLAYPVGSVYFCYSSTDPTDQSALPASISSIGTWSKLGAAMTNIYAWLRTA